MSYAERERERERVRLTPLAGSARKALPILLAAALLAAPGAAGANSGGQTFLDDWYIGRGGQEKTEAIGGEVIYLLLSLR